MLRRLAKHALEVHATRRPCHCGKCRVMPQGVAKFGTGGHQWNIICRAA